MKHVKPIVATLTLALFFLSCAKERPVKEVLANGKRVKATAFDGTFLYLKSTTSVKYAGEGGREVIPGGYQHADLLVKFVRNENTLDVVSVDPLFREDKPVLHSNVLASFKIKNVDILRKQNPEGEDTHEEEETQDRNQWNQREYIVLDPASDTLDALADKTVFATSSNNIEADGNSINLSLTRQLKDDSLVSQRYSFLAFQPSSTYEQKTYSKELQTRFGFFKTTTYKFDKYGRITLTDTQDFINRFDTSKSVVYYLSKNFPEHLKPLVKEVFAEWNEAFHAATGKDVLEIRENSGQTLGDLRYNLIVYDDTVDASHGILGYGPSVTNPRTGEIVKGDVMLFGGVLAQQVYRERILEQLAAGTPSPTVGGTVPTPPAGMRSLIASEKTSRLLALGELLANPEKLEIKGNQSEVSLKDLRETYAVGKQLQILKQAKNSKMAQYTTVLDENLAGSIHTSIMNRDLNDQEIEKRIFKPLLTHELGHNLGLRHNFMGTVDERHFENGAKSSSTMDYVYASEDEPKGPGAYDRAAIHVSYGKSEEATSNALAENYFYCTDEHTMSSENALCNQFDSGTNLQLVIQSQGNRYFTSYLFNNLRWDRAHFSGGMSQYLERLVRMLLPLRLMYDHANAVTVAAANSAKDQTNLWKLLRQRIEADTSSNPANLKEIQVLAGTRIETVDGKVKEIPILVKRVLDMGKLPALIKDAQEAKNTAFDALISVILDADRPDYSSGDTVHGDLLTRGVILDKLLAMQFLVSRTDDPLSVGALTTVAQTLGFPGVQEVLRVLISGVQYGKDAAGNEVTQSVPIDINLREQALDLLLRELAQTGGSPQSKKLIAIEHLQVDKNSAEFQTSALFKARVKAIYKKVYQGSLSEEETKKLQTELDQTIRERGDQETHVYHVPFTGSRSFVAPIEIAGLGLKTATGDLLRHGINEYSAIHEAIREVLQDKKQELAAEMAKPDAQQDKKRISEIVQSLPRMERMSRALSDRIEQEESFIELISTLYDPR